MIKCYFGFVFGGVHRGWDKKKEFGEQSTFSTLLTHELRGPEGDDYVDPERVLEGPWLVVSANQRSGKVSICLFKQA